MDTSKQYIKMCAHPVIQREFTKRTTLDDWDCSDFVYDKGNKNWYCLGGETGLYTYDVPSDFIWLPRQDQIQELMYTYACQGEPMVPGKGSVACPDCIVMELKVFSENDCDYDLNSMEQLWLAFYMQEKHNLMWGGKKWEKEK